MTIATLESRKSVTDLTVADLEAFPIWEYVGDEDEFDETYVKPVPLRVIPAKDDPAYTPILQVAAEFQLADGSLIPGLVEVDSCAIRESGPRVFVGAEQLDISPGLSGVLVKSYAGYVRRLEAALNKRAAEIFPITWMLRVPYLDGGPFTRTIRYPKGDDWRNCITGWRDA